MSSGNSLKSSEVAVTFSEILNMTQRKSHTFDSEKVGRYIVLCGQHFFHAHWIELMDKCTFYGGGEVGGTHGSLAHTFESERKSERNGSN